MAGPLADYLCAEGITIHTSAPVVRTRREDAHKIVTALVDGQETDFAGDAVLVAAGRVGNTDTLGLAQAGVNTEAKGFVVVDEQLQTSQPHIWAIGDVKGGAMFTHVATYDGPLAALNAVKGLGRSVDYRVVPRAVFSSPGAENCALPSPAVGDCCAVTPAPTQVTGQTCPVCGAKGKAVDPQTVKAMLDVSLRHLTSAAYRFCRTESCEIVYYGDGGEVYTEDDLRERVHQKHPDAADVFVCYCFRHTPASIRRELLSNGTSTVVEQVNAGIQAGQCACEIRNPQGSCCMGNVTATVKRVQKSLAQAVA